ncbi:MAG: MFS transporter [Deltaproteobacteria bacterium]|nr:MFS transporter [Deltaproteobacteria bacterium]
MRTYRGLPAAFWTVWVGTLLNRAGAFVVPFLALYTTSARGQSEATAGLVVSVYGAGSFAAAWVGGSLADHIGRRRTMLLSLFGGAVPMLAIAVVKPLWALAAATFLMGGLSEMYRPAVSAFVSDVVAPQDRIRAFGLMYWAHNLGFALAPVLAGWLSLGGFTLLFIVDAATMVVFGAIVFFALQETKPTEPMQSDKPPASLLVIARDRVYLAIVLLTWGTALVMWQNGAALPLDMKRTGHSPSAYGSLIGINGALIVFLQPPLTRWLAGKDRSLVMAWSSLLFGAGMGLYAFVTSAWGYAAAIALWTVGEVGLLPTISAVVADLAPRAMRGRYQGASNMAWGLAACLGPAAGGSVLLRLGPYTLWGACAAIMFVVALAHTLLRKRLNESVQARRESPTA